MSMNLLEAGGSIKDQAMRGMQTAARLGQERENTGRQLKAMHKQTQASMAGSGMGAGAMIGFGVGGPVGAGIGAVVGGLAGFFGADLF